jgi:hypothetical protein
MGLQHLGSMNNIDGVQNELVLSAATEIGVHLARAVAANSRRPERAAHAAARRIARTMVRAGVTCWLGEREEWVWGCAQLIACPIAFTAVVIRGEVCVGGGGSGGVCVCVCRGEGCTLWLMLCSGVVRSVCVPYASMPADTPSLAYTHTLMPLALHACSCAWALSRRPPLACTCCG